MELAGYLIVSLIGRGGMGSVYRARQTKLRREVALKIMAPDLAGDRPPAR
jgi:eukaryotic-like serine/threonine-protein kinase